VETQAETAGIQLPQAVVMQETYNRISPCICGKELINRKENYVKHSRMFRKY